jgi:uncharacterized protein (TIGR03437 family)
MPGKKTSAARCVLLKGGAFFIIVLAACLTLSWFQRPSAAWQSPPGAGPVGSPFSPRALASRAIPGQSSAAATTQRPVPREDFDSRVDHQRSLAAPPETTNSIASGSAPAQVGRVSRLKRTRPSVKIRWSSLTGAPSRIYSQAEALSDPTSADAGGAARSFLKENEDLFRLSGAEVDGLKEAKRYVTDRNGVTHLTLQQQVGGIDLFQSALAIHVNREGAVIAASGELIPSVARAVNLTQPKITALEALRAAAGQTGAEIKEPAQLRSSPVGADARQEFASVRSFGRDVKARLVYFPLSGAQARLAWEFVIWMRETPDVYLTLIDAERNTLLYRHNLTDYEENPLRPHGMVYAEDSPRPDSPHTSDSPPVVERQDAPFRATPFNGSATFRQNDLHYDWWAGSPATGLVGNNADVHLDRDAIINQPDLPRLTSPIGNFTFPVDFAVEPATAANQKAAQVNLFYWINRYHDILYSFGFNEAAGNFQTNNFGLGGRDNDAIIGDAQDGGSFNNANFTTPPDGQPGRVQMYLWNFTSPQLDGAFDQSVILHELTHGVSNRLIGDGTGLNPFQSAGMGEGWSDYLALSLLSGENDDPDAAYLIGQYVFNNYANGIRQYPYSVDMRVNPLTFDDLSSISPPFIHNVGEIWCSMLWEMRALLIKQHGFREGQQQSLQLVVDGLKMTPSSPTFIDARDAILLADRVNNRGTNQCLIWRAFAKRGLGVAASTPDPETSVAVESFETAPACNHTASLRLDKRSYVDNETVHITLGDSNAKTPVMVNVTSSKTGDQERLRLEPDPSLPGGYNGAIRLEDGVARIGDGKLQGSDEAGDQIDVVYFDGQTEGGGSEQVMASAAWERELVILDDDVERGNQIWLSNGSWKITDDLFGSPTHSWRISIADVDPLLQDKLFITSPPLDLTGLTEVTLSFSQNRHLTGGVSYGWVAISTDDGAFWSRVKVFTDKDEGFITSRLRLPGLEGQARARLRFELFDFYRGSLGPSAWAIDDIRLTGRSADPQIVPPGNIAAPVIAAVDPAFGLPTGGTQVTISGSNFTEVADTLVTFDGIPAERVTVLGSSAIIATTPAHRAGPVIVRVANHRGTATLARGFTYYEPGCATRAPALGGVSPASGSVRGGTVVTLTGANFTPETVISFGNKEALVTFVNGNMLRAVTPAASTAGPADVTARNGGRQVTLAGAFNYTAATPPVVRILNPQGGEQLYARSAVTIRWESSDNREVVKHRIAFSVPAFGSFSEIAPEVSGNARSFNWTVPSDAAHGFQARIHVTAIDDEGAETEAVSDLTLAERWEPRTPIPLGVDIGSGGQYVASDRYLYAIGLTFDGDKIQRYDPETDTWTSNGFAPPPSVFKFGEAVFLDNKIYIPGGLDSSFVARGLHLVYDVIANTWTTQAEAPVAGWSYALAVDNTRGVYYYTGGVNNLGPTAEVRMYDPSTGAWTDLPPMSVPRWRHKAAVIEGKLYVAGGRSPAGFLDGEVYDFATGQWAPIAPLNRLREYPATAVVRDAAGNPYWLFLGDFFTAPVFDAEIYDLRNNRCIQLDGSFGLPLGFDSISRGLEDRTLLGGGVIGGFFYMVSTLGPLGYRTERLPIAPLDIVFGGQPPVLAAPATQVGAADTEIKFTVSASDLDSVAPLTIAADGLPSGADFTTRTVNNNRTVGVFKWTPTTADIGRSFSVSFTASDGQSSDTKQVIVRVVEALPLALMSPGGANGGRLAVDSIGVAFGSNLAAGAETARSPRLPFDLMGTTITINGVPAPIFSVAPDRVSFLVPATIEPGAATVVIRNPGGQYSIGTAEIVNEAPAIFTDTAEANGATASLTMDDGTNLHLPQFKMPVDNRPNLLTLYATGIRRVPAANPIDGNGVAELVNVTIDGKPVRVLYAGAQGRLNGLDQIIVEIPAEMAGIGLAEVVISVNGGALNRAALSLR